MAALANSKKDQIQLRQTPLCEICGSVHSFLVLQLVLLSKAIYVICIGQSKCSMALNLSVNACLYMRHALEHTFI